jgi:hypothetical protein
MQPRDKRVDKALLLVTNKEITSILCEVADSQKKESMGIL